MNEDRRERPLSTADMADPVDRERDVQEGRPEPVPRHEAERAGTQRTEVGEEQIPLLDRPLVEEMRSRWNSVQTDFVDEPRSSVEQADTLVAEVMKRVAETFASERRGLEEQWNRGDQVSTEDLRVALQRYRSFFNRLLSL